MENSGAIKIIIVVMTVALFVWIFLSWNMALPSLPKVSVSSNSVNNQQKVKQLAKKAKAAMEEEEYEDDDETITVSKKSQNEKSGSVVALLKNTIKDKVEKKIQEKEVQKVISFPKDKPTFDISLLQA
jgi:hypothetical protein